MFSAKFSSLSRSRLGLGLTMLAAAMLGFQPSRASAGALPGANGDIVFGRQNAEDNRVLWTVHPDGTGQKQVTFSDAEQASWSPNGRRIAFERGRDIYTMSANGTGVKRLTTDSAGDLQPTWSPDGKRIAFISDRGDKDTYDLYTMNTNGSGVHRIIDTPWSERDPSWSPDGTRLVFIGDQDRSEGEVYSVNVNGSPEHRLTFNLLSEQDPSWSPDGTKILFARANANPLNDGQGTVDLFTMNGNGSGQVNITPGGSSELYSAWSPDGKKIVFVSLDGPAGEGVYVMNASGGSASLLVHQNGAEDHHIDWGPRPRLLRLGPLLGGLPGLPR